MDMERFRELLQSFKNTIRRLIPAWAIAPVAFIYRRIRAIVAATMYGLPGNRLKIIAVTGTNGKTTTASFIGSILEAGGSKIALSSTAYFQIGRKKWVNKTNLTADYTFQLQRFLARAKRANVDYVILEVTAHGLHQHRGLWGFKYYATVMTNLTQDHLDYFKTMRRYAAAKGKLFATKPAISILNRDDEWFHSFDRFKVKETKLTYGKNQKADVRIEDVSENQLGNSFTLRSNEMKDLPLKTKLVGEFNVYNATAAATLALAMGIKRAQIKKGIHLLDLVPGRMESVKAGQPFTVLVDYAHTPDALEKLLTALQTIYDTGKVILVFGATGDRDKEKRPQMGDIAARLADRVLLTDDEPYTEDADRIRAQVYAGIDHSLRGKVGKVAGRRKAIREAVRMAKKGDVVVIAGMGHQNYMMTNEGKIPWNDRKVTEEELEKMKF